MVSIDSCCHRESCPGCVEGPKRQEVFSQARAFFSQHGISDHQLVDSLLTGWRTRARLAARRDGRGVLIGLFHEGSHKVLTIPQCLSHHSSINRVVDFLNSVPSNRAYDEASHKGDLRYVQVVVNRSSGCAQVTLVLNATRSLKLVREWWTSFASSLYEEDRSLFHSIYLNYHPQHTNVILGQEYELVCGESYLYESILDVAIPILPAHFVQSHPTMFERLLEDMLQWISQDDCVLELYAGMGIMSLVVSSKCRGALAVERSPGAEASFNRARSFLPERERSKVLFCTGEAESILHCLSSHNTVIVDPPRKGVSRGCLEAIVASTSIRKMIYVSCCFESLKRDVEGLLKGGFSLMFSKSYRFFPGTSHIETLVVLARKESV